MLTVSVVSVKWGSEVNAEVFATRIAWAAGYFGRAFIFCRERPD